MTEIQEGVVIEIVMNTQPLGDEDVEIRPHSLVVHSYKKPTFCDYCGEMLFGMFKQVNTDSKENIKCTFNPLYSSIRVSNVSSVV